MKKHRKTKSTHPKQPKKLKKFISLVEQLGKVANEYTGIYYHDKIGEL